MEEGIFLVRDNQGIPQWRQHTIEEGDQVIEQSDLTEEETRDLASINQNEDSRKREQLANRTPPDRLDYDLPDLVQCMARVASHAYHPMIETVQYQAFTVQQDIAAEAEAELERIRRCYVTSYLLVAPSWLLTRAYLTHIAKIVKDPTWRKNPIRIHASQEGKKGSDNLLQVHGYTDIGQAIEKEMERTLAEMKSGTVVRYATLRAYLHACGMDT